MHAQLFGYLPTSSLHVLAMIDGVDPQVRLFLQQRNPNCIGASTDIQYFLTALHIDGVDKTSLESVPETETGDTVGAIIVAGDIFKYIVALQSISG